MSDTHSPGGAASPDLKRTGMIAGLLALLFGCGVLYLFVELGLVEKLGDGAFVAVVALPMIAYALVVYSDRVSEVSAGGIAVKFAKFANAEVDARATSADAEADVGPLEIIEKSSFEALRQRRHTLTPKDKVAVTFQFAKSGYYTSRGVRSYLNVLLAQDAEMPVIFVDKAGAFVASTLGVKLRDALNSEENDDTQRRFLEAIEKEAAEGLAMMETVVAVTKTPVLPKTTNSQALEAMLAEDASTLISVDAQGKPTGVVRRDSIMAQMLATLAAE